MSTLLWHDRFENDWMRAFPLGNGRIGAMVFGNPSREQIEINEESLWSGRQIKEKNAASPKVLDEIRTLLFQEKYEEAARLCRETFLTTPPRVRFYESFGNLFVDYEDKGEWQNYRKELDLSEAIVKVSYEKGDTKYYSETFVSEVFDALVHHVETNDRLFSCSITIDRAQDAYTFSLNESTLLLNGKITYKTEELYGEGGEGMSFGSRIYVTSDGQITSDKTSVSVKDATYITLYGAFATNYNVNTFDIDETIPYKKQLLETIDNICSARYEDIKAEHLRSHKQQFSKVSFGLESASGKTDFLSLPTDKRIKRMRRGDFDDLDLFVLYYNFGRYLLLESSGKKAALPANLQGKWCTGFRPPWGSDYHTNINMQMNYWPAGPSNLSDTMKPFLHFMKKMQQFGTSTARELFSADGWVINHTTDVFGRTGVHDSVDCGFYPMAGPWLCLNLWENYEYTNDKNILEEIYPILKNSCCFIRDYLIESPDGYLVTSPSNSPENRFFYIDENGEKQSSMFTYGATMDFEIIYALFTRTIAACRALHCDKDLAESLQAILAKLPPLRVSERYGTICEWIKDYEETEPGHRHISHLFGLYPGDQINETDEQIYHAAQNTLKRRIDHNNHKDRFQCGWTLAWCINFYARLKDGDNAELIFRKLLTTLTAENLFDKLDVLFQIDGNLGATAGVTEMLLQSHLGTPGQRIIEVLPALPSNWNTGFINGIKARGNFTFDIAWQEHRLTKLTISSQYDNILRLKMNDTMNNPEIPKQYIIQDSVLEMEFRAGENVEIVFH